MVNGTVDVMSDGCLERMLDGIPEGAFEETLDCTMDGLLDKYGE